MAQVEVLEMADDVQRPTLTPAQFGDEFGISRNTVSKLLNEGAIPSIRLGRRWFIPRAAVESWLATAGQKREPVAAGKG